MRLRSTRVPLAVGWVGFIIANSLAAAPTAINFCYPVSPIGSPGDGQIVCPVDGDSTPDSTTYYYNGQSFLEYNTDVGKYHLGDDWNGDRGGSTDYGHPVYAIADGVVVYVDDRGHGKPDTWGKVVVIEHTLVTGERVYSLYGHLAFWTVPDLCHTASSPLCIVKKGQQIGAIGDANGYYAPSTPPGCPNANGCAHLHLEIRKVFNRNNSEIIPGHGYIADANDSFIGQNYYDPTKFIEAHRGA